MNAQRIITYHHTRNFPPIQMSIYNQMMIITICTKKVNTLSLAGTVHDQWEEVTGRHVDPLGHLILNLSQPICLLIVDFVCIEGKYDNFIFPIRKQIEKRPKERWER